MRRSATVFSRGEGRDKTWWTRLNYMDEATGKRRDRQRRADSYAHAKELAEALAKEFDESAGRSIDAERMTFGELADYCEKHYYKAAQYHDERKVAGVRGLATAKGQIKVLREYFGQKRIRRITYADLRAFRSARLATKSERTERNLSIATVNRELSTLRRMFNVAVTEGWIIRNPFNSGAPLISTADERRRERILTADEEKALLLACSERQRAHLRPLVTVTREVVKLIKETSEVRKKRLLNVFSKCTLQERIKAIRHVYEALLPTWQAAKSIYKDNRARPWQKFVKSAYPALPDDLIERLSENPADWSQYTQSQLTEKGGDSSPSDIALEYAARMCGAKRYQYTIRHLYELKSNATVEPTADLSSLIESFGEIFNSSESH